MGRALLVLRLARADIRRHPVEATLLLAAITAATATLALGLALRGVTNDPYQRTRSATAGPDVVAGLLNLAPPLYDPRPGRTFDALVHAGGVVAHSGPYPVAWATLRRGGTTAGVAVEGRDQSRAAVDQPLVTEGRWISGSGDAVVEAGYAAALRIHVGDRISLNGERFRVVGLGVTAAVPEYPSSQTVFGGSPFADPGVIWVSRPHARELAGPRLPVSYLLNLRLGSPAAAPAFVDAHDNPALSLVSAQTIQGKDAKLVTAEQRVLTIGSSLLGLLAAASAAVLVGGRMAEQERRVGLLKAVGATPALVSAVMLVEHLLLALGAATAGLLIGRLAAPLLTDPGAGLVGSAGAPSITASSVILIAAFAFGIAIVATLIPTLRAARRSTMRALADSARTPRRSQRLISLSTRLPIPLLLGLRLMARRPRRSTLAAFSIAVTVTTVVAVVSAHSQQEVMTTARFSSIDNPRTDRIDHSLLLVSVILLILAAINTLFVTWSTVIDARQPLTVARALGATPRQITLGLSAAQVIPALPGAIIGIPAGIALVAALTDGHHITVPATWSLIAVFVGSILAIAALSSIPARLSAQRRAAAILQAEPK